MQINSKVSVPQMYVIALLEKHNIDVIFMPPNCTDRLHPKDLFIKKSTKDVLKQQRDLYLQNKRSGQFKLVLLVQNG